MNKFTLALAALSLATAPFAQADAQDAPSLALKPAVTELTEGGHYYIYDAHNERYGFFYDQNADGLSRILGSHILNSDAYGQLPEGKYVWTATKNDAGNWQFQNVATGHYIGNTNNASETPGALELSIAPDQSADNVFAVKNLNITNGHDYWNADYPVNGGSALSYWEKPHPFMFYAAVEEGDEWNFDADVAYTITVVYTYEGVKVDTQTVTGVVGTEYSFSAPRYYVGEDVTGVIGEENETITVECTDFRMPFLVSESVENAKYQAVYMHTTYLNRNSIVWTYDEDEDAVIGVAGSVPYASVTEPYTDSQMFAFIGTYGEGFKIYNKAAGCALLKDGDTTILTENLDEATVWEIGTSRTNTAEQYFVLRPKEDTANCLNIQPVGGQWVLKYWWDADNGSTMWAAGLSQPAINGYNTVFNGALALATESGNEAMAARANEGLALVATVDPWTEIPAETAAELDAIKAELEVAVYANTKKQELIKYFEASYTGVAQVQYMLPSLDYCSSIEEIDAQYNNMVNVAMQWMQSDMEAGSMLKNKRNGFYLNGNTGTDPDDDEIIITTFSVQAATGINALWIAEFTDDGNSVMPENRKFYLRNVATNCYLGNQSANIADIPVVAAENKAEEAALLQVVAGNNGFELLMTNDGIENNFVNTANYVNAKPVTWQYANDGGAFWIAAELPSFSRDEVAVSFIGETETNEWGGVNYKNITGIEIKVPVGATATGFGEVAAYVEDDMTGERARIFNAPVATVIEGQTPTQSTIKTTVFDADWNPSEVTYDVDVYTVMLSPERTAPAGYRVEVSAAAFQVESEENGTKFTPAMNGYADIKSEEGFEIEVTPAMGTVEALTEITLNSATGMGPVYGFDGGNITLKYNVDTTVLNLNADDMVQYDSFSYDDMTKPFYTIPVNKSEVGTYNFVIPAGFFENDNQGKNAEVLITWTIEEVDGINAVTSVSVNGEVIYDLQGRKVAKAGKGLYIINGKKTLVK